MSEISELNEYQIMIILALYRARAPLILEDIRKLIGGGKRHGYFYTLNLLKDLEKKGFIEEFRIRRLRAFRLTEKGKKFAEELLRAYYGK